MTVRVGVVGLGAMGRTHVLAYAGAAGAGYSCRLTAVCDRNPERLAGKTGAVGNIDVGGADRLFDPSTVFGTTDPEALFARDDVDLVSICTRTDTHVDLALAALRKGKHVVLEKPVALSADAIAPLVAAASASGRLCMPAMCMRFWPAWSWLLDAVSRKTWGRVKSAVFSRLASPPAWSRDFYADPSRSGGALIDLHIHDADFVRALLGEPESVVSTGGVDHVTTLYRFGASGPSHVVAEGGWNHTPGFAFRMRFVVVMEGATADFEFGRSPELLLCRDGKAEAVPLPPEKGYDGEIRHAISAISRGAFNVGPDMADALRTARLLDAERESLRTGSVVRL